MKFCQIFLFIAIAVSFSSIQSNGRIVPFGMETGESQAIPLQYLGYKIYGLPKEEIGERVAKWNRNYGMNPEELGSYVEGDILFSNPTTKNAYAPEYFRWPGAKIPYYIMEGFSVTDKQMIMAAINDFHEYTCLRFVPRTNETAYIRITAYETGCHSAIGRDKIPYNVNLQPPSCTEMKGTVIHELMHAAGFLHEQSRSDRDDYISILWDNIKPGNAYNFYTYNKTDLTDFGVPYDYQSVMHYSRYAFSANGYQTIIPKQYTTHDIGQRVGFSQNDVEKINRMYKCNNKTPKRREEHKPTVAPRNLALTTRRPQAQQFVYCWPNGACYLVNL